MAQFLRRVHPPPADRADEVGEELVEEEDVARQEVGVVAETILVEGGAIELAQAGGFPLAAGTRVAEQGQGGALLQIAGALG